MNDQAESTPVARRVIYQGRVQGVGFRVTAQRISNGFAVAGTVRNLPNGSVELVAQGKLDVVDEFLAAIADHFRSHIRAAAVSPHEVDPQLIDFSVVR